MAVAKNKTVVTSGDPVEFLQSVTPPQKKRDCLILLGIIGKITNEPPQMWGESMVGFGSYHYKYDSGREGDMFRIGFSPRKQYISIYIMPGYQNFEHLLSRLGKHKAGKSCLNIIKLSDIDLDILSQIMTQGLELLREKYPD